MPLREVLDAARLAPDVEITARSADPFTNWIHRRTGDADIYFVANGRRRAEDLGCTFRVTGRRPELWDPMTGKTRRSDEHTSELQSLMRNSYAVFCLQ